MTVLNFASTGPAIKVTTARFACGLLVVAMLLFAHNGAAAELEGRIRDGAHSDIKIVCPSFSQPSKLFGDGQVSVRQLPSGVQCKLSIDGVYGAVYFRTDAPVARVYAEIIDQDGKKILLPRKSP